MLKTPADFDAYELNSAIKVLVDRWPGSAAQTFKCQQGLICLTNWRFNQEQLEVHRSDPCFYLPHREPELTRPV